MSTSLPGRSPATRAGSLDHTVRRDLPLAALGAVLALAVSVIHVMDQGGLTAMKDPAYLGYGYWALEIAGVVTAAALLSRRQAIGWLLAVGVALGPLLGIIVSRSVGLPNATDDIGNWFEPIGVASMVVEAALLVLALAMLRRRRSTPALR